MSSTTITGSILDTDAGHVDGDVLGFIIAWSRAQPDRVGEVALFPAGPRSTILGRGECDGPEPGAVFFRQRPGEKVAGPPLEGSGLSRRQLAIRPREGALLIERAGKCELLVNGEPLERTAVLPGDTVHLKRQLLLFCVVRPPTLSPLRTFDVGLAGAYGKPDANGIVGESPAAWRLREQLAFAAQAPGHVLVTGPSGTGKELAARAVHQLSARRAKPFVARNAATFPSELIDAELFGNIRGFPNPGTPERPGLIGEAHGGTLFLDEIGDLPERLQAHLLRVLDKAGEYQRLGESSVRRAEVRLVAATNRSLDTLRPELLARFALRVPLPSLDDRREDIPLLAQHVLMQAMREAPALLRPYVENGSVRIEAPLVEHLMGRAGPKNIREVEALVWSAIETSGGTSLRLTDAVRAFALQKAEGEPVAGAPLLREPSAEEICASAERHGGNLAEVARDLGFSSRYALYRALKRHGIDLDSLRK